MHKKTASKSVQELILMPFVAEAAAANPEAMKELDLQYSRGIFQDCAVPAGERMFYRNFFEWNDPVQEYDCRRALSPLLKISRAGVREEIVQAVREVMKKGWPMMYHYIDSQKSPVPFVSFWIEKILRKGGRPSEKEIENLPGTFQTVRKPLCPAPHYRLPHTAPALSRKITAYFSDGPIPAVQGNPTDPVQWRSGQIRKKKLLDGEFPVFVYITVILNKKIQDDNPVFGELFSAQMAKQNSMRYGKIQKNVPPEQKIMGEKIWAALRARLHGFPQTLEEYFLSSAGKRRKFWPSYSAVPGIPANLFNEQRIEEKTVKKWIFSMAAHVPPHGEITEQILDEAEFFWLYLMVLSVCGQACGSVRGKLLHRLRIAAAQEEKARRCIENSGPDIRSDLKSAQKEIGRLKKELDRQNKVCGKLQAQYHLVKEKGERRAAVLEEELEGMMRSAEEDSAAQEMQPEEEESERALLAEKKIIFAGGMPSLRQKLKTSCPAMVCIGPDDGQFDGHVIRGADLVVIYWKYMGHSLFHRISALAGRYGVPLIFACASHEGRLLKQISQAAAQTKKKSADPT